MFGLSISSLALLATVIVPESPQYLYSFGKFAEARQKIKIIARYNGCKDFDEASFKFDTEVEKS